MAINPAHPPTWPFLSNRILHSDHILQGSVTQQLTASSSRTRYVAESHYNSAPTTTWTSLAHNPQYHLITHAPHTPPIKQTQHIHQHTRSRYTGPENLRGRYQSNAKTPIYARHSSIHTKCNQVYYTLQHKKTSRQIYTFFRLLQTNIHHMQ